jgi:hypothetical protein
MTRAVLLLSLGLITSPTFAQQALPSNPLLTAKTIAIVVVGDATPTNALRIRDHVSASVARWKKYAVIEDPDKADLALMVITESSTRTGYTSAQRWAYALQSMGAGMSGGQTNTDCYQYADGIHCTSTGGVAQVPPSRPIPMTTTVVDGVFALFDRVKFAELQSSKQDPLGALLFKAVGNGKGSHPLDDGLKEMKKHIEQSSTEH